MEDQHQYLGRKDGRGVISRHPRAYATGVVYNPKADPTATTVDVGNGYFYVLPIGVGAVDAERHAELVAAAGGSSVAKADTDDAV